MKFIIDAQLPKSLSDFLNQKGLNSIHTLDLPERNKTKDGQIAKLANEEERIVVSKDIDFLESFLLKSEPKKLIVVRTGNIPNRQLISIFEKNLEIIMQMISRSDLLEITKTEIAEHGINKETTHKDRPGACSPLPNKCQQVSIRTNSSK